jgi:hypothetical protein
LENHEEELGKVTEKSLKKSRRKAWEINGEKSFGKIVKKSLEKSRRKSPILRGFWELFNESNPSKI